MRSMRDNIIERLLELIKEDVILHDAVVNLLEAKRDAEKARQKWYESRTRAPR